MLPEPLESRLLMHGVAHVDMLTTPLIPAPHPVAIHLLHASSAPSGTVGSSDASPSSATIQLAVADVSVPAAPQGLVTEATAGVVSLTWSPVAGAASYTVYRSLHASHLGTAIATGLLAPAYTDSQVSSGRTYFYSVSATNLAGESAPSLQTPATATASVASVTFGTAWGLPNEAQFQNSNSAQNQIDGQVALPLSDPNLQLQSVDFQVSGAGATGGPVGKYQWDCQPDLNSANSYFFASVAWSAPSGTALAQAGVVGQSGGFQSNTGGPDGNIDVSLSSYGPTGLPTTPFVGVGTFPVGISSTVGYGGFSRSGSIQGVYTGFAFVTYVY
jgi:hypothetical protein